MTPQFNRDFVLFHLREAQEAVEKTIAEIVEDSDYDDAVFWPAMQHLYRHVNSAWNARETSPAPRERGVGEGLRELESVPH